MDNNKLRALRFLLLKHLWRLRHSARPEAFRQIADTLVTQDEREHWLIRWQIGEEAHSYRLDKKLVPLYQRADVRGAPGASVKDHEQSEAAAADFAAHALGLPPQGHAESSRTHVLGSERWTAIASVLVIGTSFFLVSPTELAIAGVLLVGATMTEFWFRKGKLFFLPWGFALLLTGLPWLALAFNLQLALLHFFDPDARFRGLRVLFQTLWAAVALYLALTGGATFHWNLPLLLCVAFAAVLVRWLTGTHFIYLPLVLPMACAALALENHSAEAWLSVSGSLLISFVMSYKAWKSAAASAAC